MASGIVASAIGGAGEGVAEAGRALLGYAVKSKLQEDAGEIQRLRDERLAEMDKAKEGRLFDQQKQIAAYQDELRRKPGMQAATEIDTETSKPSYDEGTDSVRPRTPGERAGIEEKAYRKQGMISEAMQVRQTEQQRVERQEGHAVQREQMAATERYHNASLAIQAAAEGRMKKGSDLDAQIKEITLGNLKEVESLRKEFTATQDPERKKQITETIQLLTGKDNDQYVPVPDGFDQVTGKPNSYKIFDKKRGTFLDPQAGGGGAQPSADDIAGLQKRAGNPQAIAFFESKFGKGAASKYLPQEQPKPAAPAAAAAAPNSPPAPPAPPAPAASAPANDAGAALDAARSATTSARAKLQAFGQVQRGRDPQGYARAQEDLQQALEAQAEAEKTWNASSGATGDAARMRVRSP